MPHLLFYGPPGTGKTSTILALSKQLFGPDLFRSRVLELNASDERGISIVRNKIKDFARQQLSAAPAGPAGAAYLARHPCPPFKIVVLDEADSMTQDAQAALRRTMETYSRITRFCLVCNYVTRIIDPLASRCSKFRFKSLDAGDALARLDAIADAEGVRVADGAAQALVGCAEGDLRKAITFLQSAARLVGAVAAEGGGGGNMGRGRKRRAPASEDGDAMDVDTDGDGAARPKAARKEVTVRIVQDIAGVIPTPVVERLVAAMQPGSGGKRQPGATYTAVAACVTELVADGWSATQLVSQLFARVAYDETVADAAKGRIMCVFSEVDKRLVDGADEHLVVLDLCLRVSGMLGEG